MVLLDIANEYITYNVHNKETCRAVRLACELFDRRSGLRDVQELDWKHIANWRKQTEDVANAFTYNGYLAYIKTVSRWGANRKYLNAEPILMLRRAPVPMAAPKAIDLERFQQLLRILRDRGDKIVPVSWFWLIVIQFVYGVGLRRRQLVELQYRDIDWESNVVLLRAQGSKNRREWSVPLIPSVHSDLKFLIEAIESRLGREISDQDHLFNICYFHPGCTPDPADPARMRVTYVSDIMKRISKKTGIRIGAHRLRHTTATNLCNPRDPNCSPDIFFAQHVLGHSSIATTRGYVQTRVAHRQDYMRRMLSTGPFDHVEGASS